ncbi:H(+)-transporting two-sector ATPase [Trypanosoma cruzi]|nr:H(+)-transporting two-sector ATPase [Trypanosoma cruzi]
MLFRCFHSFIFFRLWRTPPFLSHQPQRVSGILDPSFLSLLPPVPHVRGHNNNDAQRLAKMRGSFLLDISCGHKQWIHLRHVDENPRQPAAEGGSKAEDADKLHLTLRPQRCT